MENNEKLLPFLLKIILSTITILSLSCIILFLSINKINHTDNLPYIIDEINIMEIPVQNLISYKTISSLFDERGTIKDAITFLAKENKIDKNIIKDILLDERINNQAYKKLYATSNNQDNVITIENTDLMNIIINQYEIKYSTTLPSKLKNQLTTIASTYINEVSKIASSKQQFNIKYIILISIALILISYMALSLFVYKNWIMPLKILSISGIIVSSTGIIYISIQKLLVYVLQTYIDSYSYTVNGVTSILLCDTFIYSSILLLLSILVLLFYKDIPSLKLLKKEKSKKKKKKRKKTVHKKKKNNKKKHLKYIIQKINFKNIFKIKKKTKI